MNIPSDLHATQRRATLRQYAQKADRQIAEEDGTSPLPAFIALGIVCLGIWAGLWVSANVTLAAINEWLAK